MNNHKPRTHARARWTEDHDAAVERVAAAAARAGESGTADAERELRATIHAARDVGVGWTKIGDILGIASGNAYQRYRNRPIPSSSRRAAVAGAEARGPGTSNDRR